MRKELSNQTRHQPNETSWLQDRPKVSVVMSVYNGEKYLREAVESILNQTFKDFEFIIVNDGSTDKTEEILESYVVDERVKIISQENLGLTKSLNKAIRFSKGEYIARMDADDISHPNRLELQTAFLDQFNDVAIVGTACYQIDEDGNLIKTVQKPIQDDEIKANIFMESPFIHGAVMCRRKSLEKIGWYREKFKYSQDYDLWLRAAENFRLHNLPTILYKLRMGQDRITVKNSTDEQFYTLLALEDALNRRRENCVERFKKSQDFAVLYYRLGREYFRRDDFKNAKRMFYYCILLKPYFFKAYPYLLSGFLGRQMIHLLKAWKRNVRWIFKKRKENEALLHS